MDVAQEGILELNVIVGEMRERADEHFKKISAAIDALGTTASDFPEEGQALLEIAKRIASQANLAFPEAELDEESERIVLTAPAITTVDEPDLPRVPGLHPVIARLFREMIERLADGQELQSFQMLMYEAYEGDWQTVTLSGNVKGSAVTAAKDTATWEALQEVITRSIKVMDEGLRRILFHGSSYGWDNLNIPGKTLYVVRIAAEHLDAWNEVKQKLIVWFGLPDSDVTYS